jgi:hypothetical protein
LIVSLGCDLHLIIVLLGPVDFLQFLLDLRLRQWPSTCRYSIRQAIHIGVGRVGKVVIVLGVLTVVVADLFTRLVVQVRINVIPVFALSKTRYDSVDLCFDKLMLGSLLLEFHRSLVDMSFLFASSQLLTFGEGSLGFDLLSSHDFELLLTAVCSYLCDCGHRFLVGWRIVMSSTGSE